MWETGARLRLGTGDHTAGRYENVRDSSTCAPRHAHRVAVIGQQLPAHQTTDADSAEKQWWYCWLRKHHPLAYTELPLPDSGSCQEACHGFSMGVLLVGTAVDT